VWNNARLCWAFLANNIIAVSIQLDNLQFIIFYKLVALRKKKKMMNFFLNKALFHFTSVMT